MTSMRPVTDLTARRSAHDDAVTARAAAPVTHVTQAFLDALNCRGEWALDRSGGDVARRRLFAV